MKRPLWSTVVTALIAVTLGVTPTHAAAVSPEKAPPAAADPIDPALEDQVSGGGTVRVNVVTRSRADLPAAARAGKGGKALQTLSTLPVTTLRVDKAGLDKLAGQPGVVSVTEDVAVPPTLDSTVPLIGADKTAAAGNTGAGTAVAVLDTGVAVKHPFLGDRVIAEACFSSTDSAAGVTSLCPDGTDQQEGPGSADVETGPCAGTRLCDHGTHVAGIAAGHGQGLTGAPKTGVAPGAGIVAIQVFSKFSSETSCGIGQAPCVRSYSSDQLAGLEKVLQLRQSGTPVVSANMSLGGGQYTAACDTDVRKAAIDNLRAAGVATVISAGNNAYSNAVGAPGCISSAITVGSTTDDDQLSSFTNRGPLLDVFAPGSSVVSSVSGNTYASYNGTSMAAPHVAGAFAALKQAHPQASVTQLETALESTGKPISYTGATTPRIQLDLAVMSDCTVPGIQTHGIASSTWAISGSLVHDGRAFVTSRGRLPVVIAEYDLATKSVVPGSEVKIPDGPGDGVPEGAYGLAAHNGKLYIGTYVEAALYSYDLATRQVKHLKTFGSKGDFIWSLAAASDGTLYAGTYNDGKVYEYKPSTGAVRDFGVLATGERYVRSLAVDDTNVYAGLLDTAKMVAINRSTGAVRTLAQGGTGFTTVSVGRTRVRGTSGSTLYDVKTDGTDLKTVPLGTETGDMMGLAPDYTVYLSTRPDGNIYEYKTGYTAPKYLGTPVPQDETRGLFLNGTTLTGFAGFGKVWQMDTGTGQSSSVKLKDAGFSEGAEKPQSMLRASDGKVWVGGHFIMNVHTPGGGRQSIEIPGEAKTLVERNGKIYSALYPSGRVIMIDPATIDPATKAYSVSVVGQLPSGQQRPWDMEYDAARDRILVATAPLGTGLQGALNVFRFSGPTATKPTAGPDSFPVVTNESLMSLTVGPDGIVYVGTDVRGGGGAPSTSWNTAASVAAFDADHVDPTTGKKGKLLWAKDPYTDDAYDTLQDITIHDNVLYGVYKRIPAATTAVPDPPRWFAMDLSTSTRPIIAEGSLPGYGEVQVHNDKVFASTFFNGDVYQIGPGLTQAKHLATALDDDWYTNPQLAFIPGTWQAYGLVGRDLATLRLDPSCAKVTGPHPS
ncbi:S8 family serine peptidase [Streptomyces sp. NPDC015346]|uniref:S8 family serine peptidase n=1 Tax=Streptomyces sp. NPDC015346 TaxID=3364954 RepID=UPI0036FDB348